MICRNIPRKLLSQMEKPGSHMTFSPEASQIFFSSFQNTELMGS